jgi:phenylpropionate dioxygenase-like ring-hydroxylating dioxygenase large terminal subunit
VKRRLTCPYHQWTYDINDGSLSFARDFNKEDGFLKEHYRLKPVALERAGGYMFINVAQDPRPFTEGEAFDRYLAPFELENGAKVAYQTSHVLKGNWKMVWENNRQSPTQPRPTHTPQTDSHGLLPSPSSSFTSFRLPFQGMLPLQGEP